MIPNFKPLNPWGRSMPKPRPRFANGTNPYLEPLYQVHVELTESGKTIPVGPKWPKQAAEQFIMAINAKIAEGKERAWANPHLVPATSKLI